MDQVGDNSTDKDWVDEISIKDEIKKLDDRERNIMYLRFMQGKTQMEVAREVGISQAQVSRLEKTPLNELRASEELKNHNQRACRNQNTADK